MKTIKVEKGIIEGKERLKLFFPYDKEIIELGRTIPGARWAPGERCWQDFLNFIPARIRWISPKLIFVNTCYI
ncbi:MAG TPA: hypothetical protein PKH94_06795 [Bacteroidales bacterium]|nr:hypothetical protein [Bacteroidales bacterium]HNS46928.1 hypothetical protein [Bacteroidales bacterium]